MRVRRPWARLLVPVYRAGLAVEAALRRRGWPKVERLRWPVVSVGSLSAGGAGKTPVVMALAKMLAARGWQVDVLSRGYGRSGGGIQRVVAEDDRAAERFGDEPVLVARRTGVPVWVGAKRFGAGVAAENAGAPRCGASQDDGEKQAMARARVKTSADSFASLGKDNQERVHLLDDGFQHRELHRDFEVVVVTAEDLDDALLPMGNLREPLTALERADAVVVRRDEVDRVAKRVWPHLREGAQMWVVGRALVFPKPLGVLTAGLRPLAFCALARPEGFAAGLAEAGCAVIDTVVFRDHAPYGEAQLREIEGFAKRLNASGLVTTEKDAVKLSAAALARLEASCGPVCVVRLDAVFEDADAVGAAIESRLASRSSEVTQ